MHAAVVSPGIATVCMDIENPHDARLIAAAPDLLEACVDLVGKEPCRYDHNEFCQEHYCSKPCKHETARAAIAKALGESS